MSPSILNNSNLSDMRMRDDFVSQTTKHLSNPWEDQIIQATKACEAWKTEVDESNRKVRVNQFHKTLRFFVVLFSLLSFRQTGLVWCDINDD